MDRLTLNFSSLDSFYGKNNTFGVIAFPENDRIYEGQKIANVAWFSCREQFHEAYDPKLALDFLFMCNNPDFVKGVEEAENRLNLAIKTKFYIANNGMYLVSLSPFWKEYQARTALFSIIVRACVSYGKTSSYMNLDACFAAYSYSSVTNLAISKFFAGSVYFDVGISSVWNGWYNTFSRGNNLNYLISNPPPIGHRFTEKNRFEYVKEMAYFLWDKDCKEKKPVDNPNFYWERAINLYRKNWTIVGSMSPSSLLSFCKS